MIEPRVVRSFHGVFTGISTGGRPEPLDASNPRGDASAPAPRPAPASGHPGAPAPLSRPAPMPLAPAVSAEAGYRREWMHSATIRDEFRALAGPGSDGWPEFLAYRRAHDAGLVKRFVRT